MKSINYILFIFLFIQTVFSQKIELTIIDKISHQPIDGVNIYYPNLEEGTFTNLDGKASINYTKYDLKLSHVNYDERIISANEILKSDIIYLNPKSIILDEVIVSNFDLKKALNYVLENYEKLYVDGSFEKECSFKEELFVDNNIKRLIVSKVNWWDKSYEKKKNESIKLRLGAIDFNKNVDLGVFLDAPESNKPSNNGFIEPKSLINAIYLNSFLNSFLTYTDNMHSTIDKSTEDQLIISFESEWKNSNDYSSRNKGLVIFDKVSKAILYFKNEIEYKNKKVVKQIKSNNKSFSFENVGSTSIHTFLKKTNGKYSINSFNVNVNTSIEYDSKVHSAIFENSIYILKESKINKVSNDGLIDLDKPIFKNLPSNIISNKNSMLLTVEEKKFIFN